MADTLEYPTQPTLAAALLENREFGPAGNGLHVVLVAPDPASNRAIRARLERAECTVADLGSGDCYSLCRPAAVRPDALVVDARGEGATGRGLRLIRDLRSFGWRIPMIVLTDQGWDANVRPLAAVQVEFPTSNAEWSSLVHLLWDHHRYARMRGTRSTL